MTATHQLAASGYPDHLLHSVYEDLRKQNLRDYSDHETRWKAERLSAIAAERKRRGINKKTP